MQMKGTKAENCTEYIVVDNGKVGRFEDCRELCLARCSSVVSARMVIKALSNVEIETGSA